MEQFINSFPLISSAQLKPQNTFGRSLWETLNEKQKQEILLALEESEDDSNLISNDEVMARFKKYLSPEKEASEGQKHQTNQNS
jgi:hypothetical protein